MLTLPELASHLNITTSRLYDRWREWGIPAIRVGQSLRFRLTDVERWLENQKDAA